MEHVYSVSDRVMTLTSGGCTVQHCAKADTIKLEIQDGDELASMDSLVLFAADAGGRVTRVMVDQTTLTVPAEALMCCGLVALSLAGYKDDGTRVVTKAMRAEDCLRVSPSGPYDGSDPSPEGEDILGQLTAAAEAANEAAQRVEDLLAEMPEDFDGYIPKPSGGEPGQVLRLGEAAPEWSSVLMEGDDLDAADKGLLVSAGYMGEYVRAQNALNGTLGPDPLLSADDAYATKPRGLTVYGETRQNLWVNPSGTSNGITAKGNADGSFSLSGTAAAESSLPSDNFYTLKPSTSYTVSIDKAPAPVSIRIEESTGTMHYLSASSPVTFVTDADIEYAKSVITFAVGATVSGTYRVMLNEGSEAEPWCPPGLSSVDELSVVTAGKNLLDGTGYFVGGYAFGYPAAYHDPDSRTPAIFPYTTLRPYYGIQAFFYAVAGETYTFSQLNAPDGAVLKYQQFWNGQDTVSANASGYTGCAADGEITGPVTFEYSGLVVLMSCLNTNATGITWPEGFGIQVESGSTATAYEPPQVTTTPIDLDGHSLRSLPDGTCDELTVDATGVVTLTKRVEEVAVPSGTPLIYVSETNKHRFDAVITSAAGHYEYENSYCDKLPCAGNELANGVALSMLHSNQADKVSFFASEAAFDSSDAAKKVIESTFPVRLIYPLDTPQTFTLPSVTLPALPAPTVNVWADAEASGTGYAMGPDVEMEYERDINITIANIESVISGLLEG